MQVAERGGGVAQGGGADARDGVVVDLDADALSEAGDGCTVAAAGQGEPECCDDRAGCQEKQGGEAGEQAHDPAADVGHHKGREVFFF